MRFWKQLHGGQGGYSCIQKQVSKSKRSVSKLVNVIAWYTESELVCKLPKLSTLRRDSVSRLSRGCVTEWIVYQVIWVTFWHAYVMFGLNSLLTRIYRFAQQNPFSFLRSGQIRRSVKRLFAVSHKLIKTVDIDRDCAQGVWAAILTSV